VNKGAYKDQNDMNKAQSSAARLHIGPGFAHMHSQEKCIWVDMN